MDKNETIPYIRVGTTYYKLVQYPSINGDYSEVIIPWSVDAIRQDHGRDYLSCISKYDGFVCIPGHIEFSKIVGTFYNTYSQLTYHPKEGACDTTLYFLEHIFGSQLNLGLDYLQLIYLHPTQILPILCLVSQERNTGKSTFLKWLKEIFSGNMTYLTNEGFNSQFNSDWANKLLICVDEVLFNKEELTERIKYLNTTDRHKFESKGRDKQEVEFFGKFILCSNNETNFIKIDPDEIRFWVIKVNRFEKEDVHILEKLKAEAPAFLHFLQNRKMTTENTTRMWFTAEQIRTPALLRLFKQNQGRAEHEIASILLNAMETLNLERLNICPQDIWHLLKGGFVKISLTDVRRILHKWQLEKSDNSNSYKRLIVSDGEYKFIPAVGRYFTVDKAFLCRDFDEMMK